MRRDAVQRSRAWPGHQPLPSLQALVYFTLWLQLLGFSDPQVGLYAANGTQILLRHLAQKE